MAEEDSLLIPIFKSVSFKNERKSEIAGRPIFEDCELVEVRAPGMRDFHVHPVWEISHYKADPFGGDRVPVTYAERFSKQYQQFKAKLTQTKSGTPLSEARFLTEARRAELRAQNVYTIEQLAGMDGEPLKNLGPNGREFKNKAQAYLDDAKAGIPNQAMASEIEALRSELAITRGDLELLTQRQQAEKAAKSGEKLPDQMLLEFDLMSNADLRGHLEAVHGHPVLGINDRPTLLRMCKEAHERQKQESMT